jgi:quercetin dioxygenase-like cupin family protein
VISAFSDFLTGTPLKIWDGVIARAVHGERVTFSVVELDADCFIPEHTHENEQVGMVVLGSVTFRVADETRKLGPGGNWRITANVPHEVRTGPEGAVVIEAFSPCRDDWAGLERDEPRLPRWPEATDQ